MIASTMNAPPTSSPAQELRERMTACRVSFTWLGTSRALNTEQRAQAAEPFGAAEKFLSAGKKLFDTAHPTYRAVTAVRAQIVNCWRGLTLPYPEPGVRLIRQDRVTAFDAQLQQFQGDLATAVQELDEQFHDLKAQARRRLGTLFNPADYPSSLTDAFQVEWDFPAITPPDHLQQLSPELYERECARVQARFEHAVELAEEAFTGEFAHLVSHLCERLAGTTDGQPKIFRDSAVAGLQEFFDRFRTLSVRSSADLDRLVDQAQQVVRGVAPQQLRDNSRLRQQIATGLSAVQSHLDQLLVDRPRRNILRAPRTAEAT